MSVAEAGLSVKSETSPQLPSPAAAPLAALGGAEPPAPEWFRQALAHQPERSFVDVEGAQIELLCWGKVGNPGLMFIHGNGAHADWWSFIAPFFAGHYRVAAISLSGNGGSGWRESYSVAQFGREVMAGAQAAQLWAGPRKPVLIGHSFGGFAVLQTARAHGEAWAGVASVDTPVKPPEQTPERAARGAPHRVYPTIAAALARFRLYPLQPCENLYLLDFVARRALKPVEGGWMWRFDPEQAGSVEIEERRAYLANPQCPIALMRGELSGIFSDETLDYMRQVAPPGTPMLATPGADHHVMLDQPLAFVASVRGLLAAWPR